MAAQNQAHRLQLSLQISFLDPSVHEFPKASVCQEGPFMYLQGTMSHSAHTDMGKIAGISWACLTKSHPAGCVEAGILFIY